MDILSLSVAVTTFVAVMLCAIGISRWFEETEPELEGRLGQLLKSRLESAATARSPRDRAAKRTATSTQSARQGIRTLANEDDERGKLQARLIYAGIYVPWALPAFLAVRMFLTAVPPILGLLCGRLGWVDNQLGVLLGAMAGGMGMLLPSWWLNQLKRRRHIVLSRSLPDFLDLTITCLESGLSIEAALQRVIDELEKVHPLLGGELRVVQTQIELGATPEVALRSFADRSDYDIIRALAAVVQQARRFGAGIADALRQHADGLRNQREQAAEEKAQKASVQILLPTMLLIFPAIFVVLAGPAAIKLSESFGREAINPPRPTAQISARPPR
jgi:tight adherence protein C